MADWLNNLGTGLGNALIGVNNPFGLAPPEGFDRNAAMRQGALNLGMNVLANGSENPAVALGRGYRQAQVLASDNQQNAMAAQAMMAAAEEKKRERVQEQERQQMIEAQISQLPPELQGLARIAPEKVFGHLVDQQFPDPQGGAGAESYYGVPIPYKKPDGTWGYGLPSKGGGFKPLEVPGGGTFVTPEEKAFGTNVGAKEGAAVGEARGDLPGAIKQAGITSMKIDKLAGDPNLDAAVGWTSYLPDKLSSNAVIGIRGQVRELMGGAFLEARQLLKGGGQITDFEGQKAEAAYTRMETAIQSSDATEFRKALVDFKQAVADGVSKLQATARVPTSDATPGPAPIPQAGVQKRLKYNPATGELE